jgi:cobalt-zinc-cadmium efflux system membrane fusion protein
MKINSNEELKMVKLMLTALIAAILPVLAISGCGTGRREEPANAEKEHADKHSGERDNEISLSPETLEAAKLEFASIAARPVGGQLRVSGSVEINQQQMQQATPLVSGRVERVYVALGDRVRAGQPLSLISSPQIAQMHGKLHEAETKLGLAERELERVLKAENRAEVLKAKARLDQAEAALKRTSRLIELGAGAGKDLIAAEAEYKTAKAEYEFQRDISLNRQVAEAKAAVATAKVDVSHIRYEMKALGAPVVEGEHDDHTHDTSLIILRSPISGTVVERLVNPGAGIEAGRQLFTVANLSTVWVIANVPEAQVIRLRVGEPAQVFSAAFAGAPRSGRISYIDPQLDEETRTAKVRIELPNREGRLKAGMFAEVEFQTGTATAEKELVVPEAAIQRIGERAVVFVAEGDEPGHFKTLDVETGGTVNGLTRILSGLKEGDRVVTKGSFTLKTQLMKSELKEDDH